MIPIDMSLLPAFAIAALVLAVVPGPDMALIGAYSITQGRRAGLMCVLGIVLAGVLQTMLVAAGLGKLLQALPALAEAVKIAGAAYLAWLGLSAIRAACKTQASDAAAPAIDKCSDRGIIMRACLGNLMNPKALLFFSLFLPQFVVLAQGPVAWQLVTWGLLLTSIAAAINTVFVMIVAEMGRRMGVPAGAGRLGQGVLGIVFVSLAARVAMARPAG